MTDTSIINSIIKDYDKIMESKNPSTEFEKNQNQNQNQNQEEKKISDPNYSIDYKVYKNNRIKTLLSKNKIKKSMNDDQTEKEMNILTLNLYTDGSTDSTNNLNDIDKMSFEEKYNLIERYIKKKNIVLSEIDRNRINDILIDDTIVLKKYISVSTLFGDITKISFIVKNREMNEYYIDLNNLKSIKKENKKRFLK
jgi:hypothetical protein